jgi:hypothetical protein
VMNGGWGCESYNVTFQSKVTESASVTR